MLGDLIANLDRPDVAAAVLATLDPNVAARIERRAAAAAMIAPDFIARAVPGFVEPAHADLWLHLLPTISLPSGRCAKDPALLRPRGPPGGVVVDKGLGAPRARCPPLRGEQQPPPLSGPPKPALSFPLCFFPALPRP